MEGIHLWLSILCLREKVIERRTPPSLILAFLQSTRVSKVVPPCPPGTRALEQREILASRQLKTATKPAENRGQFAVCSLNKDKLYFFSQNNIF